MMMRKAALFSIGLLSMGALVWQGRAALNAETVETELVAAEPEAVWVRAEGRLVTYPNGEARVGSEINGRIERILVEEGSQVQKGQLLLEVAADEERATLREAHAQRAEADALLRLREADVARDQRLVEGRVISARDLDRSRRELEAAVARRQVAEATVQRLEARVAKSRIAAPLDGVVISREVEPGEIVEAGAVLLIIANLNRTRIEAEVDEFDAANLRVGSTVRVAAEGFSGSWRGRVEEIPDAVTPRRLKPQDPGRPADTRVLIVKVALEEEVPLRLGQRVEVEIEGGRL